MTGNCNTSKFTHITRHSWSFSHGIDTHCLSSDLITMLRVKTKKRRRRGRDEQEGKKKTDRCDEAERISMSRDGEED